MRIRDLVWDVDDTLVETYPYMVADLARQGIDVAGQFITPQNGGAAFEALLKDATFMYKAEFAPEAIYTLARLKAIGYRNHICTHRGYTSKGRQYTSRMLGDHSALIDSIFVLDPARHNNKVEFLDQAFGEKPYVLFDDRPIFDKQGVIPQHVMLRTQAWNQDIVHEHRFDDFEFEKFYPKIRAMVI